MKRNYVRSDHPCVLYREEVELGDTVDSVGEVAWSLLTGGVANAVAANTEQFRWDCGAYKQSISLGVDEWGALPIGGKLSADSIVTYRGAIAIMASNYDRDRTDSPRNGAVIKLYQLPPFIQMQEAARAMSAFNADRMNVWPCGNNSICIGKAAPGGNAAVWSNAMQLLVNFVGAVYNAYSGKYKQAMKNVKGYAEAAIKDYQMAAQLSHNADELYTNAAASLRRTLNQGPAVAAASGLFANIPAFQRQLEADGGFQVALLHKDFLTSYCAAYPAKCDLMKYNNQTILALKDLAGYATVPAVVQQMRAMCQKGQVSVEQCRKWSMDSATMAKAQANSTKSTALKLAAGAAFLLFLL